VQNIDNCGCKTELGIYYPLMESLELLKAWNLESNC
jgi:hypothetical protein